MMHPVAQPQLRFDACCVRGPTTFRPFHRVTHPILLAATRAPANVARADKPRYSGARLPPGGILQFDPMTLNKARGNMRGGTGFFGHRALIRCKRNQPLNPV
jgi:hypothetical protein